VWFARTDSAAFGVGEDARVWFAVAEDIKAAIARTARYAATLPAERNVRTLERTLEDS
jgi:hypothetical protein